MFNGCDVCYERGTNSGEVREDRVTGKQKKEKENTQKNTCMFAHYVFELHRSLSFEDLQALQFQENLNISGSVVA